MSDSTPYQDKEFKSEKALRPFLKRLFVYSFRQKKLFWPFLASILLIGLVDAIQPLVWMFFLDRAVVPGVEAYQEAQANGIALTMDYTNILMYGGLFLLNGIFASIAVHFFVLFAGKIKEVILYELRQEMFAKLQKLSFSFYDKSQTGWLLSRLTSDAQKVCGLISWGFLDVVWGFTMITACLVSMLYFNWKLALIVALVIPVLMLVSIKIRVMILKYSRSSRRINSDIIANYTEHINGVEVNKITAQEERVSRDFGLLSQRMREVTFKADLYTALYKPLVIFMGSIAAVLVIYFGGKMLLFQTITIGLFAAFFRYAIRIFDPINEIAHFYAFAQSSLSAGERIFGLLDEEIEIDDLPNSPKFEEIKGDITFDKVDFYYVKEKMVLENFNLKVKAGQSIALVGPTGEGKSTIVNLVARFYEPKEGRILIDGIDYKEATLQSLRSQLGMVLQTPHLFAGTVRENVRYAKPTASDAEIKKALQLVAAEELIDILEEEVGEGGDRLSMGQKQLISFARAILANPRIFIMDEATSSIDTVAESNIQKGIEELLKGRTSFIIAHRLSTIKHCDRILVINKGAIVEDGSHKELMSAKGKYYNLYTKQLRSRVVADSVEV